MQMYYGLTYAIIQLCTKHECYYSISVHWSQGERREIITVVL